MRGWLRASSQNYFGQKVMLIRNCAPPQPVILPSHSSSLNSLQGFAQGGLIWTCRYQNTKGNRTASGNGKGFNHLVLTGASMHVCPKWSVHKRVNAAHSGHMVTLTESGCVERPFSLKGRLFSLLPWCINCGRGGHRVNSFNQIRSRSLSFFL